jgi:hypothetical protein
MTAFQEVQRLSFGSARLFGTDASGNTLTYGQLNDIGIDVKIELKEAYGENAFPFGVADGHRSIDIQAKYYLLTAQQLSDAVGGGAVATTEALFTMDEVQPVASHTATLTHTPTEIWYVVGDVGGNPVPYVETSGSPVAGVSYSVSGAVLTFASGDTVSSITVTYAYTAGSATGTAFSVVGGYQNSQPWMSLDALRRDASQVDSSTGYQHWNFSRVRNAGIKLPYKEGEYTVYESSFKAFADPFGNVFGYYAFNA